VTAIINVGGLRPKLLGVQVCFFGGGRREAKGLLVAFFAFKCPGRFAPLNNLSPFDDNRSILIQQGAYMKKELGREE